MYQDWSDVFEYDETCPSCLRWRINPSPSAPAGGRAGALNTKRYWQVRYNRKNYQVHRIIWEMFNGPIPYRNEIDHINMNKSDNRLCNLRLATSSNNQHNRLKYRNNTSGYKGVSWFPPEGKWRARITLNGKLRFLGYFTSAETAHAAYCRAAASLHKEFANPG